MAEYRAIPTSWFTRGFVLERDETVVAEVTERTDGDREIRVGRARFRLVGIGAFGPGYRLEDEEQRVLASAVRPGPIGPRIELTIDRKSGYELLPVSTFGSKCTLEGAGRILGHVDPDDLLSRCTTAQLPDELGTPQIAFIIWMVLNRG